MKRRAEPTDVAAVPVRVHAVSEEAGIELPASSMVSTVGKPLFLNALLAPSLRGSRVEWALSSASLGSIAPDEGEPTGHLHSFHAGGRRHTDRDRDDPRGRCQDRHRDS